MASFNTNCTPPGNVALSCRHTNLISGECNAIGSGGENRITGSVPGRGVYSGILGGKVNLISDGGFSSIVGGCANTISVSTSNSNYSAILGGADNQISGCYSAILGGSGNSDGGLNYVGIFGQNITASSAYTLYANNIAAPNMPLYSGAGPLPVPPGSKEMYYMVVGGQCPIFVA